MGLVNRYAGIVVSGETATVKKGDKKVLETYVKEGDFVTEGDVLFCYDNEAMELQLSKLLLELEGYENTISNAEEDIPNLERQRDAAPAAQQLTYSLQIQELQANVREATYNKGLKEREIENLQEALEDTDVRAPISGRVMSVKNTENTGASSGYGDDTSGSDAYITIMDMTTYQVKGTINELNVGTLSEGMNVLIRSRLDESVTWSGVLDSIDWETKVQSNNSPYYGGGARRKAVHREGDIVALLQPGDDLIFAPLGVIFTEGHAALFQPVASVRRPDIGRGIGVHNIIFRQPKSLADLLLAVVRLNVHVLAENEAGHVVELHIERVLG